MDVNAQQLFDFMAKLYPTELKHVLAEMRAFNAEKALEEREQAESAKDTK